LTGVPQVTTPTVSNIPTIEAAPPTATIIPFPARRQPDAPTPQERLARALESLNAALADQKEAIAAWRDVLGELKSTTTGLDQSLQQYRTTLRTLGTSVSSLRAKARSLEQWADSAIAASD
jgi:septal ring factor EnvC (AmiA/AmiB activator)